MAELKEIEDERKAKRELLQIQLDAESQMKRRIVRDHFKNLYVPFDTQPDPKVHEGFIKQVLRAMEIIIKGEGDVKWVEEECRRTWFEEREQKQPPKKDEETGAASSLGFEEEGFQVAKRLFLESDMSEDLEHLNSVANRQAGGKKRYGLTMNKKKDFVNQFLALERDAKGKVTTAIDAVEVKSLGIIALSSKATKRCTRHFKITSLKMLRSWTTLKVRKKRRSQSQAPHSHQRLACPRAPLKVQLNPYILTMQTMTAP